MRKFGQMILVAVSAAIFAGCNSEHLDDGCYQPTDPADGCIACVYQDTIFLRVKLPQNSDRPEQSNYWAGKYELDKDSGEVTLKMSSEEWRNWKFYFNLRRAGNTLKIDDYSRQKTYTLISDNPAATTAHGQDELKPME